MSTSQSQTKQSKIKRTIIIDNYDSFTYNIVQYIEDLGGNPIVFKNDAITLAEIKLLQPTHIILSPGPGTPKEKKDIGICREIITELGGTVPIFGICLGHQAIALAFGADIIGAPEVMHGKTSLIKHIGASLLFHGIPQTFEAMRYHSLLVDAATLPHELHMTAVTNDETGASASDKNLCMAIENSSLHLYGVQFHPESMATPVGKDLLENFLRIRIVRAQSPRTLASPRFDTRTSSSLYPKSTGTMFRKHAGLARGLPSTTHGSAMSDQKSTQSLPTSTRKKLHEITLNLLRRLARGRTKG